METGLKFSEAPDPGTSRQIRDYLPDISYTTSGTASALQSLEDEPGEIQKLVSSTSAGLDILALIGERQPTLNQHLATDIYFLLAQAVADREIQIFLRLVENMGWANRSEDEYRWVIELALEIGAHLGARQLAQEGAALHPHNLDLCELARLLSPPRLVRAGLPPDPDLSRNTDWLRQNREHFRGQWVALRTGELIASGQSFAEVRRQVGPLKNSHLFLTRVN